MYTVACYCRHSEEDERPPAGWVPVAILERLEGRRQAYANPACTFCSGTGLVPDDQIATIDYRQGSTSESWIVAYRDGTVVEKGENDGARFLRRGAERWSRKLTRDELKAMVANGYPPHANAIRDGLTAFYGPDFWNEETKAE